MAASEIPPNVHPEDDASGFGPRERFVERFGERFGERFAAERERFEGRERCDRDGCDRERADGGSDDDCRVEFGGRDHI